MTLIKEIHQFLHEDFTKVNDIMSNCVSVDEELVSLISNHLNNGGGKRIRPALTLLTGNMLGPKRDEILYLAAAVEFIHMATLLHDDVVDGSKLRRFLPTANEIWGSQASILVGDFLFSQAFKLISKAKSHLATEELANASCIIAQGEVRQLDKMQQKQIISMDEYMEIINAKTAELFKSSTKVPAIIQQVAVSDITNMAEFGRILGIIFQLVDDHLDYFGKTDDAGKNIGDDFAEGKITLPLICLQSVASKADLSEINQMLAAPKRTKKQFDQVLSLMKRHEIDKMTINYAENMQQNAQNVIDKVIKSVKDKKQEQEYLLKLIDFVMERKF